MHLATAYAPFIDARLPLWLRRQYSMSIREPDTWYALDGLDAEASSRAVSSIPPPVWGQPISGLFRHRHQVRPRHWCPCSIPPTTVAQSTHEGWAIEGFGLAICTYLSMAPTVAAHAEQDEVGNVAVTLNVVQERRHMVNMAATLAIHPTVQAHAVLLVYDVLPHLFGGSQHLLYPLPADSRHCRDMGIAAPVTLEPKHRRRIHQPVHIAILTQRPPVYNAPLTVPIPPWYGLGDPLTTEGYRMNQPIWVINRLTIAILGTARILYNQVKRDTCLHCHSKHFVGGGATPVPGGWVHAYCETAYTGVNQLGPK
ncbi:hypothetical protein LCGC14_2208610 [marine sediment metagenome]|uniref:Uncharacterized protein n=1 Tax=marine sediment metagenome TaxID=412755 RepID=A0A0F9E1Z1_9ZZZZ